jgi:hypothetical protein
MTLYRSVLLRRWTAISQEAQKANDGLSTAIAEANVIVCQNLLKREQRETFYSLAMLAISTIAMAVSAFLVGVTVGTNAAYAHALMWLISATSVFITIYWISYLWRKGKERLATLELEEEKIDPV